MPKKPVAPRRSRIKEAHHVLEDALRKAGEDRPGDQAQVHGQVAKSLGVSPSMLYKWREPAEQGSGQPNPLHRTAQLIVLTGDTRILDWLAEKAGGQFTPVETESAAGALDQAANTLVREFGLLIADVADAIADRRVTPDETQALRTKWNGLRKRAETFVRRCEKGDYGVEK
jgi:transposase-like protein